MDNTNEQNFFLPFRYYLTDNGFFDIRFNNGPYEFGKDLIAKKIIDGILYQYEFQLKDKSLTQKEWDKIKPQIDEMRSPYSPKPIGFDSTLPRRIILVNIGKQKYTKTGKVYNSLEAYRKECIDIFNVDFEHRNQELIVDDISINTSLLFIQDWEELIKIIGQIKNNEVSLAHLASYLRSKSDNIGELTLLGEVINEVLIETHQYTNSLNLQLILHSIITSTGNSEDVKYMSDYLMFNLLQFVENFQDVLGKIEDVATNHFNYILFCNQLLEIFSYGIITAEENQNETAKVLFSKSLETVLGNKGCLRYVSDKTAISLEVFLCYYVTSGPKEDVIKYIKNVAIRILDAYDPAKMLVGLGSMESNETEDIGLIMGHKFDFIEPNIQPSMLLYVILKWASIIDETLFKEIVDDCQTLGIRKTYAYEKATGIKTIIDIESIKGVTYSYEQLRSMIINRRVYLIQENR